MRNSYSHILVLTAVLWIPVAGTAAGQISNDPLVRMPGTQPDQGVVLENPTSCMNCHTNYDLDIEPGHTWKGSMMAHSARDPLFWSAMAVAGQDAKWAFGDANAVDLCFRCHTPGGWLEGRSDPPNGSLLTGHDFDGVHCDMCHRMWDPFYESTYDGSREGDDWAGYWDESTANPQSEADVTYGEDQFLSQSILRFSGLPFYDANNQPVYPTYNENASGQFYVSPNFDKRASFSDPSAPHGWLYSRYHKSKFMCSTCHDVSNHVLANSGMSGLPDLSGGTDQISEQYSPHRYFHVERTFSEFMLSAYGQQGGAPTNPEFAAAGGPAHVASCQDCHMQQATGRGCFFDFAPVRPDESDSHPNSGVPVHDLSGGNSWMTYILASLDPSSRNYDPVNVTILDKGPAVLTLDLDQGISPKNNGDALLYGSHRAQRQLRLAATIKNVTYNRATGDLSFQIQNNTGHKLITGYPEGRRMFANVKVYSSGTLVQEVNPYSDTVGTLKGLPHYGGSPPLDSHEVYDDTLVYEKITSSTITGETRSLHFLLGTDRFKDNRIPPKGFDIANAPERLCEPATNGSIDPGYFTAAEYQGGYDEIQLTVPPGANFIRVSLYYQGTTREYIEFLRDEINGTGGTLPPGAYIIQTDPFFDQLKAWGDTIWDMWHHNHGLDGSGVRVPGLVPLEMANASWPPTRNTGVQRMK